MGLSMSDAVRLFLNRVVIDQAFPLELKVPNTETRAAMQESRAMMTKRLACSSQPSTSRNYPTANHALYRLNRLTSAIRLPTKTSKVLVLTCLVM